MAVSTQVVETQVVETQDDLLTVQEVARILRVDDTTVRRYIKNGVLEAVTLPHVNERQSYRIKRSTLNRVLNPQNAGVNG